MNDLGTIAVAMGAGWASGVRLYGAIATLGLLHHFKLAQLPGSLSALSHPWIIGVSSLLFVIEFVADKVPAVDSVWDTLHTFIRIPAGAVLASTAFTQYPPHVTIVAGLVGGTLALGSHTSKTSNRILINHSPEPVSNWTHSAAQDISSFIVVAISPFFPVMTIGLVVVFIAIGFFMFSKAIPMIKKLRNPKN